MISITDGELDKMLELQNIVWKILRAAPSHSLYLGVQKIQVQTRVDIAGCVVLSPLLSTRRRAVTLCNHIRTLCNV